MGSTSSATTTRDTILAQKERITRIVGDIDADDVDNLEEELGAILVTIKSTHFPQGAKYGHLPVILGQERIRTILGDAGFSDIAFESLELELAVGGGGSPKQAAEFLINLGPVARVLREEPDADRRQLVVDAIQNAIVPYDKGDGVRMGSAAWLVTANAG